MGSCSFEQTKVRSLQKIYILLLLSKYQQLQKDCEVLGWVGYQTNLIEVNEKCKSETQREVCFGTVM